MNSVHEPGSRTMSKNLLRNSTESNRVKNRPSAPSAQPASPAARPSRAPRAWACPTPAAARAPGLLPRLEPARLHLRPAPAQRPCLRTQFVLRYKLPSSCPFHYNTPECIAIQCPSAQHPVTIQKLYCNTISSAASCLYCNTLDLLHTSSLAIQSTSFAHPRPLYHNTMPSLQYNLAVAQIIFCTKFIIIFFSFPATGKLKKNIHTPFFFIFHNTQINL